MRKKRTLPSLLARQATGGDIAERGFKYQANLITARVPEWLSKDGFTEMTRESLGDVEAKFFVPGFGPQREFVEYKNQRLTPSEFWPEIEHFHELEKEAPGAYQRFVLACTGVSDSLKTMIIALRRARDASPFYNDVERIQDVSYDDFVACVKKLRQSKEIADFVFEKVLFEVDLTDAADHPRELFREALLNNFPSFNNLPHTTSTGAYSCLVDLIGSRRNQPIHRSELEAAIWDRVDPNLVPEEVIRLHILHDESCDQGQAGCLKFNWTDVFGGMGRDYLPPEEWNNRVVGQLTATRDWILKNRCTRELRLSGHSRLSASVALGYVFSAVSGFVIRMETKDGVWATNRYPTDKTPNYSWRERFVRKMDTNEMVVVIGVKKDIISEVEQYLCSIGFCGSYLYLFGDSALVSAEHTNRAVDEAKNILLDRIAQMGIRKSHLFMAVPAIFAVFLGHRLNATCEIQCYERKETSAYVPTCQFIT